MAGVSEEARAGLLVPLVLLLATGLCATTTSTARKTIINPDFPCGRPEVSTGGGTNNHRVTRQIIYPTAQRYPMYLGQLIKNSNPHERVGPRPTSELSVAEVYCGASPITSRFLVTAAHCVFDPDKPVYSVRLGEIDLESDSEKFSKPVDYYIEEIFVHPNYALDGAVRYYDLALLKTEQPIEFNDIVFPYCVPASLPAPGTVLTASGFGLYNATTRLEVLLEGNQTVMDTAECEMIYEREFLGPNLRIKYPQLLQGSDIFCATDNVTDACQGDSGGPIFQEVDGRKYLTGIVSAGADCRTNHKSVLPGLYVNIAKHIDFIDGIVFGTSTVLS